MARKKRLYSIGKVAELSNASPKQLRYLEAKGLLVPAVRGKSNNYRYYSAAQFSRLAYIKTLRDLGFSFEDVVGILNAETNDFFTDTLHKKVAEARERIRAAHLAYERLANYSHQLLHAAMHTNQQVPASTSLTTTYLNCKVIEVPVEHIIFTREKAAATCVELFIDRYFFLQQQCLEKEILPSGSMHAIFHDGYLKQFESSSEDLETFFPIQAETVGKGIRTFGGFKALTAIHMGPYQEMQSLYHQMEEYAQQQSVTLMDIAVEKYILGPDMTPNPAEYITQIIIPLAGSPI